MARVCGVVVWSLAAIAAAGCGELLGLGDIADGVGTGGAGGSGGAGAISCEPGMKSDCYDGPSATRSIGVCHGGLAICNSAGDGFSECNDQVLPQVDNCTTPADEDCNDVVNDHCGDWAELYGVESGEDPMALAASTDGKLAMAGGLHGAVTFDPPAINCTSTFPVAAVAKADAAGAVEWAYCWGAANAQSRATGIGFDQAGAVYATGYFTGTINFDAADIAATGSADGFIVKLDAAGAYQWHETFGVAGSQQAGLDLLVDKNDDVWITGTFQGSVALGSYNVPAAGAKDVFVARYDSSGAVEVLATFGDSSADLDPVIGLCPDGDVVLAARYSGTPTIGSATLPAPGGDDMYLARPNGSTLIPDWVATIGGGNDQRPHAVACNGSRVVVVGRFDSEVLLGGVTSSNTSNADNAFIASYDSNGGYEWGHGFDSGTEETNFRDLIADQSGSFTVVGEFGGTVDLGAGPVTSLTASPGLSSALVVRFDADGVYQFARVFGPSNDADARAITAVSNGYVVFGESDDPLDFGTGLLAFPGGSSSGIWLAGFPQ